MKTAAALTLAVTGAAYATTFDPTSPGITGTTQINGFEDPNLDPFFSNEPFILNADSFSGQTGGGVIDDALARRPGGGTLGGNTGLGSGGGGGALVAELTLGASGQVNTIDAFNTEIVIDFLASAYILEGYSGQMFADTTVNILFELTEDFTFSIDQTGDPSFVNITAVTGTISGNMMTAGLYNIGASLDVDVRRDFMGMPDNPDSSQMTQTVIALRSAVIPLPSAFLCGLAGLGAVATRRSR